MSHRILRIVPSLMLGMAAVAVAAPDNSTRSHDAAVARNLNTFNSLIKELELNYVDTIRPDESFDAAIGALLSTVDPYTEYYKPDDRETLTQMTTGEWGGIGSYIIVRDGATYISGPMENSPSVKAGLRVGDKIMSVDTVDVSKDYKGNVSTLLRGQPGTIVKVRIMRPYAADSILTFDIEREKLQQPSVPYYCVRDGHTGYIRLTSFIDKSPQEIRDALMEFKGNPEVDNIVLDLRGNGGGLLESAVDIVGFFVPKGTEVLRTRGRDKSVEKIYKTTREPIYPDIPLAVLIDGGSASASEIVAGALQDLDRAVLVGSRSFGKGLVQSTRPLPFGGLLKVTVGKYYIPSGRLIQALDYSHRNPDGSVARTPDSLTNVYKTLHGREVRDGGGLKPDVEVEWDKLSGLLYDLARENKIFDYATKFAASNPDIAPAEEFSISDEMYTEFKDFVKSGKFEYDKVSDTMIKNLRKGIEDEDYMTDEVKAQIDKLAELLNHDLDSELDRRRGEVSQYLAREIIGRYYFDRGRLIQDLKDDDGLDKAIEILGNPAEYNRILGRK